MTKVNVSSVNINFLLNLSKFCRLKKHFYLLSLSLFIFSGVSMVSAQEPSGMSAGDIAPPPLKIMSKGEKEQLEAKNDVKERTKLALVLMDARLTKAEEFDTQNKFHEMYDELGKFHALLDYTYNFLYRTDDGSRKVLGNFKRFEIGIRGYVPRIEVVRRNLPIKYEAYLRNLITQIRDTRGKTVDAFFDDSVVPQAKNNL